MIHRLLSSEISRLLDYFSVLILTGPRQSGKTTLCRAMLKEYPYINLEDVSLRSAIASDPKYFLAQYQHGLVIDEAQRMPELFSYIQMLVDEDPSRRYVLTGSSNFALMEGITQSLAGRAAVLTLLPLSLPELNAAEGVTTDELLFRGGYPAVWSTEKTPTDVYANYYATYIERDLRQLVNIKELSLFQQFVALVASRVGTEFNASSLSGEVGVSSVTIQHWLSVLEASYIIFRLPPYARNMGKRIVKSPKLYFYDTGLACFMLGIRQPDHVAHHPLRGNLFENMVVGEFMKRTFNQGMRPSLFFYRDSAQKEVDVVEEVAFRQLKAYEIKSARTYNGSFGSGLSYFERLYGNDVISSQVIYDGEEESYKLLGGFCNVRRFFCR